MLRSISVFMLLLFGLGAAAQNRTLSGTVRDESGAGVPGVSVRVKGQSGGTSTNANGLFSLSVPVGNITLEVSSVGYTAKEIAVSGGENNISLSLSQDAGQLNEVVVTALGITKDQRKVGYAVTTVNGEQLSKARETNVALSLAGRVAGLKVSGASGGPGSTARTLLRGMPSMNSGGSPLYVINGIPIDNTQRGQSGEWGGSDNGDGISNLNPDDIESMTVLKGQSASALYGARASNGVIVITTKTGKRGDFSVEYNLNMMNEKAVNFTDFQYVYGQGVGGRKPTTANEALQSGRFSWGERLDGSSVIQFDGNSYPYSAVRDNMDRFYRNGLSLTNTIVLSKGGDQGSFRLSLSNLGSNSIVRNSELDRKTINLNLEQNITNKLKVSFLANYVDEFSKARAQLSDGPMNPNNGIFLATNINQNILAPGYNTTTGVETRWSDDEYVTNPWFVVNQYVNDLNRRRLITAITARYQFNSWLFAQGRVGYDYINDRVKKVTPWGTAYSQNFKGGLDEISKRDLYELNLEGQVGASRNLTDLISINAIIGGNIRKNQNEKVQIGGGPFVLPYLYAPNNVVNFNRSYEFYKTEVQSAFYSVDFGLSNYLTLGTTGRYDRYSTLPESDNSIFTPSVTAAFIFTEFMKPSVMSFGKLRASYAVTSGEPVSAYQTAIYYSPSNAINGIPTGNLSSFNLPNLFLKPFTVSEFEIGADVRFFKNRLGLDVAYYHRKTENEIMPASYANSSGYSGGVVGTGSTENKGVELLLTGSPVQGRNFSWNVSVNATKVNNLIVATDATNNPLGLGVNRATLGNAQTFFIPGMSGPQIKAYDYKYDSKGNMVVDASGYPLRGDFRTYGSVLPTFYGGINNEFNFKGINFAFLIDYNYGNVILSATKYYALLRGLDQQTLVGRDGLTMGVTESGGTNSVRADAQGYYRSLAQRVTGVTVLNGDFIKLRQASLGYTFGAKTFANVPVISSIQLSFVARNLFYIMKKSDNIDPESNFRSDVRYAGMEGTALPTTRSFGINANIKFKK